ncbi:MAG: radical SAM protein [archaeon]
MNILNSIREKLQHYRIQYASIIKSASFSENIIKGVYRTYVNHEKVIAWVDGCPVFTTFSPPALSIVQANMEARNAISRMQNRKHPNMVNIAVTDKCNCDCIHCSFTSMKKKRKILSTADFKKVIKDSQDLGVSTITFSGGEPLMNSDLCELIKTVHPNLSVSVLFTNGWFLEEKARELKKSGLCSVNVSIDSYDAKKHDVLRKKKGAFDRAVKGIKASKHEGIITGISSSVSREHVKEGEIHQIIELGKTLKVNEVIFFDYVPTGNLTNRKDLLGKQEWTDEIIKIADKYNKRYDYPGITVYSHIKSHRGMGCAGGSTFFYVSPYGDVCPCDFNPTVLGNILDEPLELIWNRMITSKEYMHSSFGGCRMQDTKFRKNSSGKIRMQQ